MPGRVGRFHRFEARGLSETKWPHAPRGGPTAKGCWNWKPPISLGLGLVGGHCPPTDLTLGGL